LVFARGSFLARTAAALFLLDGVGRVQRDPIDVGARGTLAPLGDGYVAVEQGEQMFARAFDGELVSSSALVPLVDSANASFEALVFAPDGSATLALFHDGGPFVASLACSDQPIMPLTASSCPPASPLEPLASGCVDPVCHVVFRYDHLSLQLLGWAVRGGPLAPVDSEAARSIAFDVLNANDTQGALALGAATVSEASGGVFTVTVPPLDQGAVALIGAQSGAAIMVAGVHQLGRGDYWLPTQWAAAEDVACGSRSFPPVDEHVALQPCLGNLSPQDSVPATANDALNDALRSNLAAYLAQQGPFSAHVQLYTPTVDECDAQAAEYVVVLSQARTE
jgi:hypothetical protein